MIAVPPIKRIAIIGAGDGGCAAAAQLAQRGFDIRLYGRSRATTDVLPGATGISSAAIPSFAKTPKIYFAASASFPGGFVVLILIRSCSQIFASPESAVRSPNGAPPCVPGNPFVAGGATCARPADAHVSRQKPIAAIAVAFAKIPPSICLTNSSSR